MLLEVVNLLIMNNFYESIHVILTHRVPLPPPPYLCFFFFQATILIYFFVEWHAIGFLNFILKLKKHMTSITNSSAVLLRMLAW